MSLKGRELEEWRKGTPPTIHTHLVVGLQDDGEPWACWVHHEKASKAWGRSRTFLGATITLLS